MRTLQEIYRTSPMSGKVNMMAICLDEEDYFAWKNGDKLIQDAFPYLTPNEREFLMTGITPSEWERLHDDGS